MNQINIVIAGAAGQGVQSAAEILGKTFLRLGYHVFITQDVQSRVRGGHNFMRIRFSDQPLAAAVRKSDFLIALNEESIRFRVPDLNEAGLILCTEKAAPAGNNDPRLRVLPESVGPETARGEKFIGVKLSAMLFSLLGFSADLLAGSVSKLLSKLKPEILQANLEAISAVAASVNASDVRPVFKAGPSAERMLVTGNEAIALGMISAGVGVYAGYPMTPSTSLLNVLAEAGPQCGIVVEQAEDEIAAINIAIGASYAGARAACGTSGPGISLMAESIGLAGITEIPLVIYNGQRAGPAVGMATRTEQGDLLFMVHASHGEFPRAVLAPADHHESFYLAAEAFNIADKYQVPVFLTNDLDMADAASTVAGFDTSRVIIDRGPIAPEPDEPALLPRYASSDSGIPPRAFPALSKWMVACDSHEHDEAGRLTDNPENRIRQHERRMGKLKAMAQTFPGPEIVNPGREDCLIAWGSTIGPLLEARSILSAREKDFSIAIFRYLFPLDPLKVSAALSPFKRLITVEQNYSGQLGKLLKMECGTPIKDHIGKYDGRTFTVEEMVDRLEAFFGVKQ